MSKKPYACRSCGGTKFSHDVTVVYEEIFDSEEKHLIEGEPFSDGEDWECRHCKAKIPKGDVADFLEQMYNVSL